MNTVCMVFVLFACGFRSPHHSINLNNFNDVCNNLKSANQIVNFARSEFKTATDNVIYGEDEHWASPEEMFFKRTGDCEDYAFWISYVMNLHNINNRIIYGWSANIEGHAGCLYEKNNEWYYIDNQKETGGIIKWGSLQEATDYWFSSRGFSVCFYMDESDIPNTEVNKTLFPLYSSIDRVQMQEFVSSINFENNNRWFISINNPGFIFNMDSFLEHQNKFSFGLMYNLFNWFSFGVSYSQHGFYVSEFDSQNKLGWIHLCFIKCVGISTYYDFVNGEYSGVDIDFKLPEINYHNFIKINSFVAFRNIYEVVDTDINVSAGDKLSVFLQKRDLKFSSVVSYKILSDGKNFVRLFVSSDAFIGMEIKYNRASIAVQSGNYDANKKGFDAIKKMANASFEFKIVI